MPTTLTRTLPFTLRVALATTPALVFAACAAKSTTPAEKKAEQSEVASRTPQAIESAPAPVAKPEVSAAPEEFVNTPRPARRQAAVLPDAPKPVQNTEPSRAKDAAAMHPPLIVQADAMAIVERAREKLAAVRTLDCITLTERVGPPTARGDFGIGVRHRVQLRFERSDAISVPFFRITRIDSTSEGDVLGPTSIYDGRRSIVVHDADQSYFDPGAEWIRTVGPVIPALPQWFLSERAAAAQRKTAAANRLPSPVEPEVLGARVIAIEELDGQTCDVVELYESKAVISFSDTNGAPEIVDERRYTVTTHFARSDGMPRRVVTRDLPGPGDSPAGMTTLTTHYMNMTVNPGFEAAYFSAVPPAGYTRRNTP